MCGVTEKGDKKRMKRQIFEDGESLPIVSISDINFAYDTNMVGYPTLMSDIPELGDIHAITY